MKGRKTISTPRAHGHTGLGVRGPAVPPPSSRTEPTPLRLGGRDSTPADAAPESLHAAEATRHGRGRPLGGVRRLDVVVQRARQPG